MKLSDAVELLRKSGVPNPAYDARELFMRVGKVSRSALISGDAECSLPELLDALERRRKREPLQYILGEVGFYRESYLVSPDCLIPRSDTEILVDYAVKNIPDGEKFLDLCTGSGCVAISTLKNTKSTTAVAIDISPNALKIAERNAEKNGVSDRIEFIEADARESFSDEKFYAILSNPPYVSERAYGELEPELYFEPKIALVGESEGLEFYKAITSYAKDKIKNDGFIAFEIGYDQAESLTAIAEENELSCSITKDLSGNDRVAVLKRA